MRTSRWTAVMGGVLLLAGAAISSPARAQDTVIEKIQLQYVDARYVAAILGAGVLPTEGDLWMAQMSGRGFGNGMMGGGYGGGFGGGNGVWADPSTNSLLMLPGSRFGSGPGYGNGIYGDPQGNNLLIGPRNRGVRGNFRAGSGVVGDPNSNSLLRRR